MRAHLRTERCSAPCCWRPEVIRGSACWQVRRCRAARQGPGGAAYRAYPAYRAYRAYRGRGVQEWLHGKRGKRGKQGKRGKRGKRSDEARAPVDRGRTKARARLATRGRDAGAEEDAGGAGGGKARAAPNLKQIYSISPNDPLLPRRRSRPPGAGCRRSGGACRCCSPPRSSVSRRSALRCRSGR